MSAGFISFLLYAGVLLYGWVKDKGREKEEAEIKAMIKGMGFDWTVALNAAQHIAYPYPLTELFTRVEIDRMKELSALSDFTDGNWSQMIDLTHSRKKERKERNRSLF